MEGKCDMFVKVSDKRDIVDFVKEIEKYPCLYDRTLPEYANKVFNRRAWSIIAKKINTTVPDCRDKWRKIRISYMRSLKQQMSDKPPMRPYYLSEDLQFIRPFLKITPLKTPIKKEESMDIEIPSTPKRNISDSDCSDISENDIIEEETEVNRIQDMNKDNIKEKFNGEAVYVKENITNNFNEKRVHGRNYTDDKDSNARKMFLLSLLPDVECFTESEMRIFRRKVIDACDEIISRHVI